MTDSCPECGVSGSWNNVGVLLVSGGTILHYGNGLECLTNQLAQAKERIAKFKVELAAVKATLNAEFGMVRRNHETNSTL